MEIYLDSYISSNIELTEKAYNYCCYDFSYEEIISELSSDDEIKKQLCIINLKKINDYNDAKSLISNLTNKGGPIREVTSIKINEFINNSEFCNYFQSEEIIDIFIKAITDVNPTVSRNTIESLNALKNKAYLEQKLFEKIFLILDELKEFKKIKSHLLNKKTFNLYWCLEALSNIVINTDFNADFENVLSLTSTFNDYTIREKSAKILSKIQYGSSVTKNLIEKLKNDENIYVRRYFS